MCCGLPIKQPNGSKCGRRNMLDTVRVKFDCPMYIRLSPREKIRLAKGLNVWADGSGGKLVNAEFSAPTLLYGHNGAVLATQGQLDAALQFCVELLRKLGEIPSLSQWNVRRVDIAWNFAIRAEPVIIAHAGVRVLGFSKDPTLHHGGEGVTWRRAKSHKVITLYDKGRQMRVDASVLRAEISLRSDQIVRHLTGDEWRDFDALYRVYRSILTMIPPIEGIVRVKNFQEAIGLEPLATRNRILSRLAHKPRRTLRRYRRQIEAAGARQERRFSWAELLPENGPPAPVNVTPTSRVHCLGPASQLQTASDQKEQPAQAADGLLRASQTRSENQT